MVIKSGLVFKLTFFQKSVGALKNDIIRINLAGPHNVLVEIWYMALNSNSMYVSEMQVFFDLFTNDGLSVILKLYVASKNWKPDIGTMSACIQPCINLHIPGIVKIKLLLWEPVYHWVSGEKWFVAYGVANNVFCDEAERCHQPPALQEAQPTWSQLSDINNTLNRQILWDLSNSNSIASHP